MSESFIKCHAKGVLAFSRFHHVEKSAENKKKAFASFLLKDKPWDGRGFPMVAFGDVAKRLSALKEDEEIIIEGIPQW
jgi:hypothetical protein